MAPYFICCLLAVCLVATQSFVLHNARASRSTAVYGDVFAGTRGEIVDRKVVDTAQGAVIVANQGGKFFAVNAKCPHLGLPMKTGEISTGTDGQPTITCKFHNSQFNLNDGKCVSWCTGVMGVPGTGFLAGAMGKMGGKENSPATTYPVKVVGSNPDDAPNPSDKVYVVL